MFSDGEDRLGWGGAEPSLSSQVLCSKGCSIQGPRGEGVGQSMPEARDKEEKEIFYPQNWTQSWTGWEKPILGQNLPMIVLQDF